MNYSLTKKNKQNISTAIKIRRKVPGGGVAKRGTNKFSKMKKTVYILMGVGVIHRCIYLLGVYIC